jgi:hypothetical protein
MDRRQFLVTDLQSSRLSDPRQRPLYDPANLAQPATVWRSRPCQVVLDPSPLEPLAIARRPVLPVTVQCLRSMTTGSARLPDRRHIVEQGHRLERLVPLGARDAHRHGNAISVYKQVTFGAFFGPVRGVFAGEYPPKTAR